MNKVNTTPYNSSDDSSKDHPYDSTDGIPEISGIPAFDDNYIWFIHGLKKNQAQQQIIIVDPGEAWPVIDAIEKHQYIPQAIFITHHHGDHIGGVRELAEKYQLPVYGPANESIAEVSEPLSESQVVSFAAMGLSFTVLDVPGHTRGHIAYFGHNCLFIGDTLFAGGCGRLFEGTAAQMHHSLAKLLTLPDSTMIYCAHEYTQENLLFAQQVEPDNKILQQRIQATEKLRSDNTPTVPSSLKLEKQTNPFLRFDIPAVRQAAEAFAGKTLNSPAVVFQTLRHWKDTLD